VACIFTNGVQGGTADGSHQYVWDYRNRLSVPERASAKEAHVERS
jgi:hypothetical protein